MTIIMTGHDRSVKQTNNFSTEERQGRRRREYESNMERARQSALSIGSSTIDPPRSLLKGMESPMPHLRLEKAGSYLSIAALQAYTILTVVRCLADPTWIELTSSSDKSGGREGLAPGGTIGKRERWFLGCAIMFTLLSCIGVTLRIMDKLAWLRRGPVISAYFQAVFCIAAMSSFVSSHRLPPGTQFSHGFLTCVITVVLSIIVAIMLTIDWWRGFPSAGLSATLKALIISSFLMTAVIIIGAATYTWLEDWTFDEAVNFCIVSFATIVSAIGFFIVSLRNAVVEQLEWRLLEKFSRPAHIIRVQTRMSAKDLSYPVARFEEEQQVKATIKRTMIIRMVTLWIVLWFGGAGVFCAFEKWTYLESLYFCYVTLTTIGFGDYVPTEPGSIEFWNIYVFVGLTIFAYILSLFSESMAAHIHLVDDDEVDEDDDGLFGWEQCEGDPNAPYGPPPVLIFSRGGALGLEGAKWSQNYQDRMRIHSLQAQEEMTEISLQPGVQSNQDRPRPQGIRFWNRFSGGRSITGDMEEQGFRRSPAGHVLRVPAKERKQMLQAEYYATNGGSHSSDSNMITNSDEMPNDGSRLGNAKNYGTKVPSTIKFVDMYGGIYQKRVGSRLSMVSTTESIKSLSSVGNPSLHLNRQSQVYGTSGYKDVMARRHRSMLTVRTHDLQPSSPSSHSAQHTRYSISGRSNYGSDVYREASSPASGLATPHSIRNQQEFSHSEEASQDQYVQTSALQHQPQVRFESPGATFRDHTMSQRSSTQQFSPQSRQYHRDASDETNNEPLTTILRSGSERFPTSFDSIRNQTSILGGEHGMVSPLQEPPLLLPRRREDGDGSLTALHAPWPEQEKNTEEKIKTDDKAAAYERYLELEYTRKSHSSDTTKAGSPLPQILPTDLFSNMNVFRAQIYTRNPSSEELFDGGDMELRADNQTITPYKHGGVAPDEMPPDGYLGELITPPKPTPSQSGFGSTPNSRNRPSLNRLWLTATSNDASGLKPI
ncbi:Potassium channel [Mortierella sp. AM989]|nr:Potassium channel [Mortierella sp. AM989]